jgi:hypothetical protein
MLVTIDVTQEDIDQGIGCNANSCMVALALNRLLDTNKYKVVVNRFQVFFQSKYFEHTVALDNKIAFKIGKFDHWKNYLETSKFIGASGEEEEAPEPFAFELDIPVEFLKLEIPEFKELTHV